MLSNYYTTPRFRSARWYQSHGAEATSGTLAGASGTIYYIPVLFGHRVRLDRVGAITTTAATGGSGSVGRMGIYKDLGLAYPWPGELLSQLGTFDATATAGVQTITPSATTELKAGLYWFALGIQVSATGTPAFRADERSQSLSEHVVIPITDSSTAPANNAACDFANAYSQTSVTSTLANITSSTTLAAVRGPVPVIVFRTV